MNNILQSPREKLISNFKSNCGSDYEKMYLSKLSEELLQLKLNCYVNSLLLHVKNSSNFQSNLKLTECDNSICIFSDSSLIRAYTINHISKLRNETQLGMSLFLDWGYLLSCVEKSMSSNQLMMII